MARKGMWAVMTVFALLVAAYALANALLPSFRSPFVSDLFANKAVRAFGHLAGGGVALGVGALQFSIRIRTSRPKFHRWLGRVYLLTVMVGGVAALLMASSSDGGVPAHFGFGLLAVLWLATSTMAYVAVRARDYDGHRAWMVRSYALCLAAVMLRIYLPASMAMGIPFEQAYPAISWLCWVPNLIIAEWLVLPSSFAPLQPAD